MGKAILLHSGGIDSTVVGHHLNEQGVDYSTVYVHFGLESEVSAASKVSSILGVSHDVIDMSSSRGAFVSSSYGPVLPVPNPGKHVLQLGSLLIFGSILPYARRLGIDKIYIGYTKLDADYSPEYQQQFLDTISSLSEVAGYDRIDVDAPLLKKTKAEVVQLGAKHPYLLAETRSCVVEGETHCGYCPGCVSRKDAFKSAGIEDPTFYKRKG